MKTDHSVFEGANFFDGAKPITSHIMNTLTAAFCIGENLR